MSEYKSGDPQRGVAFLPKRGVAVSSENLWKCRVLMLNLNRFTRTRLCEHSRPSTIVTLNQFLLLFLVELRHSKGIIPQFGGAHIRYTDSYL